jgi:hypothetical protein
VPPRATELGGKSGGKPAPYQLEHRDELLDGYSLCGSWADAPCTGKAGLYERRNELPESLGNLAKHKLEGLCQKLLD